MTYINKIILKTASKILTFSDIVGIYLNLKDKVWLNLRNFMKPESNFNVYITNLPNYNFLENIFLLEFHVIQYLYLSYLKY